MRNDVKINSKVCEELGQKCSGKSDEEFSVKENYAKGGLTITNADTMVCTLHPDALNIIQSVRTPADDANNSYFANHV